MDALQQERWLEITLSDYIQRKKEMAFEKVANSKVNQHISFKTLQDKFIVKGCHTTIFE